MSCVYGVLAIAEDIKAETVQLGKKIDLIVRFSTAMRVCDECGFAPKLDNQDGERNFAGGRSEIIPTPSGAIRRTLQT